MRNIAAMLALLGERLRTPFAWGTHDCASFAFDAVRAVSGEDRFADLRGSYDTAAKAARILKRMGGLEAMVDARLRKISPSEAHRGDIAGALLAGGLTLMV